MKAIKKRMFALALFSMLLVMLFLSLKSGGSSRPLPQTSLTFLGLSNLPPFGLVSAFSLSNAANVRLLYDPRGIECVISNNLIAIPASEVVNRVAILPPGGTNLFYVPGKITNGSLRMRVIVRKQAISGPFGAVEHLVSKLENGNGEAWFGGSFSGVLTEKSLPIRLQP